MARSKPRVSIEMIVNVFVSLIIVLIIIQAASAFQLGGPPQTRALWFSKSFAASSPPTGPFRTILASKKEGGGSVEEYRNAITGVLSNFMQGGDMHAKGETTEDPLCDTDFDAPKINKTDLVTLASMLDAELYEKEWFVTGRVNPSFFADEFEFQDPDVKLSGIEGAYNLLSS